MTLQEFRTKMSATINASFSRFLPLLTGTRTKYAYGTAGFRSRYSEEMHPLFFTVGILAAFRSISLGGKCIGVMITASHNDEPDNGVKIVDVDGGMLVRDWETIAERWVNLSIEELVAEIELQIQSYDASHPNVVPVVMVGMDTRPHSPRLMDFVTEGVALIRNGVHLNLGEVITPLLHFSVLSYNNGVLVNSHADFTRERFLSHYYQIQFLGYSRLVSAKVEKTESAPTSSRKLILDTAFGVGSVTVEEYLASVAANHQSMGVWDIELRNRAREGLVNHNCGAEHAQKLQLPPGNFSFDKDNGHLLCSFDGDGDRIVFHFYASDGKWVLLDGDRIACLFSSFIHRSLVEAGIADKVNMGIVQTAYANGSSSYYLRSFGVPVLLAKTGVKYLHHKATLLDIGVYFEANGHGTVLFSDQFRELLAAEILKDAKDSAAKTQALERLHAIATLINPTVGDALSDLLCTLAILEVK